MIKIKEKPCKGTGKALGFGCGRLTMYRTKGLGRMCCLRKWYLETENGQEALKKISLKVSAPRKSLEKAIEREKQTKGIQAAFKVTKVVVHSMIRLRDKGKPCISCGCQWSDEFEAGHCYASGKFFSIRYHFDNIHGQCFTCNNSKRGNESKYHLRLPDRIGVESYERLKELAAEDQRTEKHWTKDELKAIRKEAAAISKELKKL